MDPAVFNGLLILAAAGGLYAFWRFCRTVVKWGFFTMYFLIGAGMAFAVHPRGDFWIPLVAGFSFAWTVTSIKSKIWRVVAPIAIVGGLIAVAPMLSASASKPEVKEKSPKGVKPTAKKAVKAQK